MYIEIGMLKISIDFFMCMFLCRCCCLEVNMGSCLQKDSVLRTLSFLVHLLYLPWT